MILLEKDNSKKIIKIIFLPFLFILFAGIVFYLAQWLLTFDSSGNLQASTLESLNEVAIQPLEINAVDEISFDAFKIKEDNNSELQLNAKAAISVEGFGKNSGKILFEKNADEKLPIASLVKLMAALVVLENYDLDQKVTISKTAMSQEGEQGNLKEGEILSVKNLLYITLIESSNRAAFAISEVVGNKNFIALMNKKAQELGLLNTHFEDVAGLNNKSYSTARDLSLLSGHLFLNYPLFGKIISYKEFYLYLPDGSLHHKLSNTNELLLQNGIAGGKTGYTLEAKGCFMTIQKKSSGEYAVNIILGSDDRLSDMKNLINFL